jgi:uncharacterized protein GlcG (DUF336 family)
MSNTIQKQGVSSELAAKLIDAAFEAADGLGLPVTIAVVDESGVLKALRRGDGAALGSVELAPAKARMAASFGAPTNVLRDMANDDHAFGSALVGGMTGATLLGGGMPIMVDGALVGAIGVSCPAEDKDVEIANAALAAAL